MPIYEQVIFAANYKYMLTLRSAFVLDYKISLSGNDINENRIFFFASSCTTVPATKNAKKE